MNTPSVRTTECRRSSLVARAAALAGALLFVSPAPAADIPDRPSAAVSGPAGYYKVASTNDPIFAGANREWFLDFGKGILAGRTSGTVAVSMRENPNVRVRILVWQFYPSSGDLTLGWQTSEGSKQAVILATWKATPASSGMMLRRGNYQLVMNRANEGD